MAVIKTGRMERSTPDKSTTAKGCSYDEEHLLATSSCTTTAEVNAWLHAFSTVTKSAFS